MAPSLSRSYLRILWALVSVPRVSSPSWFCSDFPVSPISRAAQGRRCTGRPWQLFLRQFSAGKGEGDGGDRLRKGRDDSSSGRGREAAGSDAWFENEKETTDRKTLTSSPTDGEGDEDDARLFGDEFFNQPFRVGGQHGQEWRDGDSLRQDQGEDDEGWGTSERESGGLYQDGSVPDSGEGYHGSAARRDEFGAEGSVDPARDEYEGAYPEDGWMPRRKGYGPPMGEDYKGPGEYAQPRGWDSSGADGNYEYNVPPTADWAGGSVEEPRTFDATQTWSSPRSDGRMGHEGVSDRQAGGPQRLGEDGEQQDRYGYGGHAYAYRGGDSQQQDQYGDGGHSYAYSGVAGQQKDQYQDKGHAYEGNGGYGEPSYYEAKPEEDLEGDHTEIHVKPYSGVLERGGDYPNAALHVDYGSGSGEGEYSTQSVGDGGGKFGDLIQRDGYTEDDINNLILGFYEPVKLPHLDDYKLIYRESDTKKQRRELELAKMAEMAKRWVKKVDEHGFAHGVGRRKTSRARVWIREGEGEIVINKKHHDLYFPFMENRVEYLEPFIATGTMGMFDTFVLVRGGGVSGQAGAIRHGLSRALMWFDPTHRPVLKRAGMLRRDDREVERKKPGKAKARKSYQWVKR